jgi:hypothetical protein
MMPVKFNKEHAQYFIDCLANGELISPRASAGWTKFDMLNLAGALYATIFSQGPVKITKENDSLGLMNIEALKNLPEEHREANEQTLTEDILGAFQWIMDRTFDVIDDDYDERFDNEHFVLIDGESKKATALEGFKK